MNITLVSVVLTRVTLGDIMLFACAGFIRRGLEANVADVTAARGKPMEYACLLVGGLVGWLGAPTIA